MSRKTSKNITKNVKPSFFSQNVTFFMKKLGLDYDDIGEKIGVSGNTVRRWESGEHKPAKGENLEMLAKVFGVSKERLFMSPGTSILKQTKEESTPSLFSDEIRILKDQVNKLMDLLKEKDKRDINSSRILEKEAELRNSFYEEIQLKDNKLSQLGTT